MRKEHQVISFLRQSFEYWTYDYFCTNGATSAVYSDTIGLFSAFFVQNGGIFSIRKRSLTCIMVQDNNTKDSFLVGILRGCYQFQNLLQLF